MTFNKYGHFVESRCSCLINRKDAKYYTDEPTNFGEWGLNLSKKKSHILIAKHYGKNTAFLDEFYVD